MRQICDEDGCVLAIILEEVDYMEGFDKRFFSDPADAIQVGSLFFARGSVVEPHRHKCKAPCADTVEVLLVLSGVLWASIFDDKGQCRDEFYVKRGDILVQKAGGHGFQFYDDARLLEIKTGPYEGRESDKAPIGVVT